MDSWALVSAVLAGAVSLATLGAFTHRSVTRSRRRRTAPAAERASRRREDSPVVRFARDVAVNVIANLVAAAVVYVGGAVAGLLPKSTGLLVASAAVILLGAGFVAQAMSWALPGRIRGRLLGAGLVAVGLGTQLVPFAPGARLGTVERIGFPLVGLCCLLIGVSTLAGRTGTGGGD